VKIDRSIPPLFICNLSFHGFLMNQPARDKFFDSHNEIVTNIDNEVWIDKNLPLIQKFIVSVKPFTIVELESFYNDLLHLKMASDNKALPPVIRMEHCMFISLANAKKAKALGIV